MHVFIHFNMMYNNGLDTNKLKFLKYHKKGLKKYITLEVLDKKYTKL